MKITMEIRAEKCPLCGKIMIAKAPRGIYPYFCSETQEAQARAKGLQFISNIKVDDEYICQGCCDNGKADFLCAMCGERKPTDKEKESFGDPREYLCTDCYEIIPAKKWDEKVKELNESHRWDFE